MPDNKWDVFYADRIKGMQASEIRELLKLLDRPGIISFAGGIPDPDLFPTSEIAATCQKILTDPKRAAQALQYAVSEGYLPLRQWLAADMAKRGVECTPDHILITSGSQQALDFIGKLFISPGDKVLASWPTYMGALQAFNAYQPRFDHLPSPLSDMPVSRYAKTGKDRPKFGYVMSEFQNPTGTTLTLDERHQLLDAAAEIDLPLVEDCAYDRLRYDGAVVPTLLALACKRAGGIDNAKVIYCGTFSKSIVPALRIGWIVAPKEVIQKLVLIKQAADLHTSPLTQMIAYEIASTIIDEHAGKICVTYKTRRDAMLKALTDYMPQNVSWTRPEGGMFVWMTLPPALDSAELLKRALAEENIAFVPGAAFFPDRSNANTLRLNFSLSTPEKIDEGIKRLGRLLKTTNHTALASTAPNLSLNATGSDNVSPSSKRA